MIVISGRFKTILTRSMHAVKKWNGEKSVNKI